MLLPNLRIVQSHLHGECLREEIQATHVRNNTKGLAGSWTRNGWLACQRMGRLKTWKLDFRSTMILTFNVISLLVHFEAPGTRRSTRLILCDCQVGKSERALQARMAGSLSLAAMWHPEP